MPIVLVIFGITGDLAKVMTFPGTVPPGGTVAAELPHRGRRW
jgi:hypothetical protein